MVWEALLDVVDVIEDVNETDWDALLDGVAVFEDVNETDGLLVTVPETD